MHKSINTPHNKGFRWRFQLEFLIHMNVLRFIVFISSHNISPHSIAHLLSVFIQHNSTASYKVKTNLKSEAYWLLDSWSKILMTTSNIRDAEPENCSIIFLATIASKYMRAVFISLYKSCNFVSSLLWKNKIVGRRKI